MRRLYLGLIGIVVVLAVYLVVLQLTSQYRAAGLFSFVGGLATDQSGNIYVLDPKAKQIQKFDRNGDFILGWDTEATDVAIDSAGNIYAAEETNHRVTKYSSSGAIIKQWGSRGSSSGQFESPYDIAVDSDGVVFVADAYNNRIQAFNNEGQYLFDWGSQGRIGGNGSLNTPTSITIDSNDNIYVLDQGNAQVQKFTKTEPETNMSDCSGTNEVVPGICFVTKWSTSGTRGIAVDSQGDIYVADRVKIKKFASDGILLKEFTEWHDENGRRWEAIQIEDVAIGEGNYVYVADNYCYTILRFTNEGEYVSRFGSLRTVSISTEPPACAMIS